MLGPDHSARGGRVPGVFEKQEALLCLLGHRVCAEVAGEVSEGCAVKGLE